MMYNKNQPETIQQMFGTIAPNYDRANTVLSFGLHKIWNKALIKKIAQFPCHDYLDLCAGTGDIALEFAKKQYPINYNLLDFCPQMLEKAKEKVQKLPFSIPINYVQADAQNIPFEKGSIDAVTTAYGIRNVKNLELCAQEVLRVLRPGGVWGILELTQPSHRLLQFGHKVYLSCILPYLGKLVTENKHAYDYLASSIQEFIVPQKIASSLHKIGFKTVTCHPLMGGIATIIMGEKA